MTKVLKFLCLIIFISTLNQPIISEHFNACELVYKYRVDEKPDLIISTGKIPGICRIYNQHNASIDLHSGNKTFGTKDYEKSIFSLQYDASEEIILYWTHTEESNSKLYKTYLSDGRRELVFDQEKISMYSLHSLVTNTAYDWVSKNMYLNLYFFIAVINIENPKDFMFVLKKRKYISNIAVHPNKGYIYFIDVASDEKSLLSRSIYRAELDGTNIEEFENTKTEKEEITNLVIDYYEDKIYWSIPSEEIIQYSNLDGRRLKTINRIHIHNDEYNNGARLLAIDRNFIYYRKAFTNSIKRLDKTSHFLDEDYEVTNKFDGDIKEIIVFTYATQKFDTDHPCNKNFNNTCENLCFAIPDKFEDYLKSVCKCSQMDNNKEEKICFKL